MSSTIAYRVTLSLVVPRCDIALHCKNVLIDTLKTKLQYSTYPDPKGFDKNVNNMSPHGQAESVAQCILVFDTSSFAGLATMMTPEIRPYGYGSTTIGPFCHEACPLLWWW